MQGAYRCGGGGRRAYSVTPDLGYVQGERKGRAKKINRMNKKKREGKEKKIVKKEKRDLN